MKSKVIIWVAAIQLVVAVFLGVKIYKKTKILGTSAIVTPVDKKGISSNPDSKLENFYEPKPNSVEPDHAPWLEEKIEYYINSDALREVREYENEKPDSTFRIVAIGDSFTFGASVQLEDNYPKQLETLLNNKYGENQNFEVINLGVRGYDIQFASERYLLRGEKYNPDLILWLLRGDDFSQIENIMRPLTDQFLDELHAKNESGYLVSDDGIVSYPWYEKALKIMHESYDEQETLDYQTAVMNKFGRYDNKKIVILTYPSTQEKYDQRMRELAKSKDNVYFYDGLANPNKTANVQPDGHPTARGYTLMTNSMLNYLEKNSLIPCN